MDNPDEFVLEFLGCEACGEDVADHGQSERPVRTDRPRRHGHLAGLHERRPVLASGALGGSFVMNLDPLGGPNLLHFGHGRPRLGVQVIQPTAELRQHLGGSEDLGILVGKVFEGTAAEKAGVMVGDLIVAVGDDEIANAGDLTRALQRRAGKDIVLEVVRDGRTVMLDATLAADEDDEFRGPAQRMRQPLKQISPAQRA